jgi:hypothetical protein
MDKAFYFHNAKLKPMLINTTSIRLLVSLLLVTIQFTSTAQDAVKLKLHGTHLYAGIEVGSKGVKMSLLEISPVALRNGNFKIIKDTSVNTDFISFTKESYNATLVGLTGLYQVALNGYKISPENIYTVFSSGVKVVAERENKKEWIDKMADDFKNNIHEPTREMKAIDVLDEAKLSHIGIVPNAKRYTTFLIDIGSGNTKGGYFPSGNTNDFKLFQLTWGTKSVYNSTEKRTEDDNTLTNFNRQLSRVLSGQADEEITYAINASGAYNMSDNIAFSGGIAWATATLINPELADNPVVSVTFDDVVKLNEKLTLSYGSLSDSALLKQINDKTLDKNMIRTEIKKVNKVFDQRAMLAGVGLLLKIMRQFEGVYEKKQFFMVKNGQVGWISAYVNQQINNTKN